MGVKIEIEEGYVKAGCDSLKGAVISLPYPSVGATENLMMAAALAKGETVIQKAAREPEIVDLGRMLMGMGVPIEGLGSSRIKITGVSTLSGVNHRVIPDRIETGTFLIAAAVTKGDLTLKGVDLSHLDDVVQVLRKSGLSIKEVEGGVRARWVKKLKPIDVATAVYPGFPTDMQAQWIALMSVIPGRCRVRETVFENRFLHVQELFRFGADIHLDGRDAIIHGGTHLSGCSVMASDLRAGAALVLAGLAAKGKSTILRVYHLDRGYEQMEVKLRKCGAQIRRTNPVK